MQKLTILLDLDSTVVDLCPTWYARYNEKYGDDLTIEKVTDWDTSKFCKHGKAIFSVLAEPNFFRHLPLLKGAEEWTRKLVEDGHRVVLATAATKQAFGDKALWVDQYMPWIDSKNVMIGYAKDMLRADALIDDGPHNLKDYRKAWGTYPFLAAISYPYNQDCREIVDLMADDYRDTERCWRQIYTAISEFADHLWVNS